MSRFTEFEEPTKVTKWMIQAKQNIDFAILPDFWSDILPDSKTRHSK